MLPLVAIFSKNVNLLRKRYIRMTKWSLDSGEWVKPVNLWKVDAVIPEDAPECWLSKPGGDYHIGISFHIPPFTIVKGSGSLNSVFYYPSDFYLARNQDPYNSWGVNALRNGFIKAPCHEHWDWLPGVTIYDKNEKFTLPDSDLSAFAGTEWSDNDQRVFHGIEDEGTKERLLIKYLTVLDRITGPRFAGWPFGRRQLVDAVFVWIHSETLEVHAMLLASVRQFGDKFSYFNRKLFDPGDLLGSWDTSPATWECREVVKVLYKARLLLEDGFHEVALVAASSAVETAFYEIVRYLEDGNANKAKKLTKKHTYRERAEILIASYGYPLPAETFLKFSDAYDARNDIAHALGTYSYELVKKHLNGLEEVVEWYFSNIKIPETH